MQGLGLIIYDRKMHEDPHTFLRDLRGEGVFRTIPIIMVCVMPFRDSETAELISAGATACAQGLYNTIGLEDMLQQHLPE